MPMKDKKILIVANADSPLLVDRVQMAQECGFNIVWFSESTSNIESDIKFYHSKKIRWLGFFNKIISVFRFLKVFRVENPDVLHIHWALFLPVAFIMNFDSIIVSVMGSDVNIPGRFGVRRYFAKLALKKAKIITSKSQAMDSQIIKVIGDDAKIRRMTWGVSEDFFIQRGVFEKPKTKIGFPEGSIVFFSPRSIQKIYRVPQIIKAFVKCQSVYNNIYLIVAGVNASSEEKSSVDYEISKSVSPNNIIVFDRLEKSQMIECYASSDVVVSFASCDGMPQTLYEAMAAGCFPIFSDLSSYHEVLIDEVNSLLCRSNDDLCSALTRYIEEYHIKKIPNIIKDNRDLVRVIASKEAQSLKLNEIYTELLPN